MKRNTALFGASVAVGLTASVGVVAAATTSSAATAAAFGISYTTATGSSGFKTGSVAGPDGIFAATAQTSGSTATISNLRMPLLDVSGFTIVTSCVGGSPQVTVTGGDAAGTYSERTTVTAAAFTGNSFAVGSVTFLPEIDGRTVGAFYDLAASGIGRNIQFGAVVCATQTTTTSPDPTDTSSSSSSTSTPTTTVPTSGAPTSGGTPTTTAPTTTAPTTTTPTTTAPPVSTDPTGPSSSPTGTQPPTPTITTTRLPVAG